MAFLKHKTRGMTTPQGKQKVYFCCHPADFALYFDKISDEILKKQNCAVWYPESFDIDYDEQFFSYLKDMQLFVVPVTTNFLLTENHALSFEFKFAIENHIPVLPLMQESGLEEIFNKKCGDLQFLDKNVTDITAISYDEKLEKYLNSILVGDELAEKIRAAFDAYVFLSYRKKDRKYAQELMRLIHKNDFCRDIAIWYDEFLTPGEDFNNSIKEALGKSELFILTVTPNLVNEVNYVMTEEYPKAKELGKVILPAELVATDKKELSKKYEDIPAPVDAHKDNELTKALLESVKKIAIKENDKSPTHNFFIGLAYLSGVDVEVDHKRALALITSSAEAGLLEAMTKLVEMYHQGIGVERSYETAIEWQEKIIEYHQEIYEKEPNEKNLGSVFSSFVDCGDYYEEIFRLEDAKEKYISAKDLLEQSLSRLNSENITKNRVKIANKLGHIFYLDDQLTEAEKYYESAMEMGGSTVNKTESFVDLLGAYVSLGDVYSGYNKYQEAEECYENARKIITHFIEMMDETNLRYSLALIYARLGNVFVAYGKHEDAVEKYYKTSIKIYSSIIAGDPNDNVTKRAVIDVYQRIGNVYEKFNKNYKTALDFYTKAFEYANDVFEDEKNTFLARNDVALSCEKMGDAYTKMGEFDDAKKCYKNAIKIYSSLVEETNTVRAISDLSISYERLGDLYSENGFFKESIEYHEISLEYKLLFAEKSNTIEAKRNLYTSYLRIGINNIKLQELEKAKEKLEVALEISVSIVEETETIRAKRDLFESYYWLGHNYNLNNELKNAKENYEKAIEIAVPLAEVTNSIADKEYLNETFRELGGVCLRLKQYNKAIDCHKNVVKLTLLLIKESDETNLKNTLCKSYFVLGFLQCHENNIDDGIDFYKKAIEISRSTNDEVAFYKLIREISENCDVLGSYFCSKKDFENARKLLENALDIRDLVVERTNSIEERKELSSRCVKLGAICEAEGNLEKAKGFYEKALEIRKAIVKENDTEESRKDLSVCYNKLSSVYETKGDWKLAKEYSDKAIDINLYGVDEQVSDDKTNSEKNDEKLIKKLKKRFFKK